jgi:NitT/TauT family transport system substrate-binding protein
VIRTARVSWLAALILALAVGAPVLVPAQPRAARPAVPAGAPQAVTFVTDFGFNGRHAPYYTALDKGFFREMGLEVKIVRGGGSLDAIRQVAAGNAQAAFADLAALITMRANDGVPVKEISIVYARPPQALYCLAESGIRTPRDLEGKRLSDSASSAVPRIFPVYAKAMGIDHAKVRWIFADSAAIPAMLVRREIDCAAQFVVGEALLQKAAAGKELVRFAYADAPGLDYYGNGIVASDQTIKTRPDLLKRLLWAVNQGLAYAFDHPDEAAEIMNRNHPQVPLDVARAETLAVKALVLAPETIKNGIGYVDPARVQKTIDIMTAALELKRKVTVDEVYADGFLTP